MVRDAVVSIHGPRPIGPYSPAVWTGSLLYCSGQAAVDPAVGRLVEGGISEQTTQTFNNLEAVLQDAGLSMEDVIKVNVYLTTMSNFAAMNVVYATSFNPPYPARTTVAVAELPLGALVEIELVSQKPG